MGSLIGSVAQGYMGYRSTQNTNAANVSIAQATNEMNRRIAESNNQTSIGIARENLASQEAENEKTRQFNSIEAEKAFQREKEKMAYQQSLNSPLEAVRQLREAGLNPALAYGDIATVQGQTAPQASSSGSLSPSMPVLSSPNMIAPQLSPYLPQFSTGVFDSLLKVKQMKLLDSQSGNYDAQSEAILKKLGEEVRNLQLSNDATEDINKLRRIFEPFERQLGLSEKWSNIQLLTEQAYEAASQGRLNDALKLKADADKILSDAAAKVKGKEGELLDDQIKWYGKTQAANIRNLDASSREHNANADYTAEKIATEPSVRLQIASEALEAWQSYNAHKLSPQDMVKLRDAASKKLEDEAKRQKGNSNWNPLQWLATIIHPLAEEIGIALGANASVSNKPKIITKKP